MEKLFLNKISPDFLEKEKWEDSEIWGKEVSINKGEYIQVIAPSGKGKTSLIHFLYGLRNDYLGEIQIDNRNVRSMSAVELANIRKAALSIVFQDLRLFSTQTTEQNLEIKRILSPLHKENRIANMCSRLGINAKLQQTSGTCSFGEQQRIAIIRALQQPFDLLLLDEPFSHLDENNRLLAMDLILEEVNLRNAAVILVDLRPISYFPSTRTLML